MAYIIEVNFTVDGQTYLQRLAAIDCKYIDAVKWAVNYYEKFLNFTGAECVNIRVKRVDYKFVSRGGIYLITLNYYVKDRSKSKEVLLEASDINFNIAVGSMISELAERLESLSIVEFNLDSYFKGD